MHRTIGALVFALALTLTACGGDTGSPAAPEDPGTVLVTSVDYDFGGLPASVPAGTEFDLTNESEEELHEIVLVRIPDGEERPLGELLQLDEEELAGMLMPNLVGVSLAPPGADGTVIVGDLIVREPGRYGVLCFIPTGADPDEYMAVAAESEGPPDVPGGPPHIVHGMFAELTVTG